MNEEIPDGEDILFEDKEEEYKPIPASDYFKQITSYNISNTVEVFIMDPNF